MFEPLGLAGIGSQLENELNAKNLTGCTLLLDRAIRRIQETTHQKSQAIWLCNELYRCAAKALQDSSLNDTTGYAEIENLMTRRQVIGWIEKLKNSLTETIWQEANLKSEPVEKARQYVLSHIEDRLSLQDVADEVCHFPGVSVHPVQKAIQPELCQLHKSGEGGACMPADSGTEISHQ